MNKINNQFLVEPWENKKEEVLTDVQESMQETSGKIEDWSKDPSMKDDNEDARKILENLTKRSEGLEN